MPKLGAAGGEITTAADAATDPRHLVDQFWRAAATIAGDDEADAERAAVAAARAIWRLANLRARAELRAILRPDLDADEVTWTVACFEIGSLAPSGLHQVEDIIDAMALLARCPEPGHVASELICSGADGLQWVAMERAERRLTFALPTETNTTAPDPGAAAVAVARWRRHLSYKQGELFLNHFPDEAADGSTPTTVAPFASTPPMPSAAAGLDLDTEPRPTDPPPIAPADHPITSRSLHSALRSAVAEVVPHLEQYLLRAVAESVAGAQTLPTGTPVAAPAPDDTLRADLLRVHTELAEHMGSLPDTLAAALARALPPAPAPVLPEPDVELRHEVERLRAEVAELHDVVLDTMGDLRAAIGVDAASLERARRARRAGGR